MKLIKCRNVHQALPEALYQLRYEGVRRNSRNGAVLVFPEPVTTVYTNPRERVMFHPERDANPFFHLFEALWMLGGKNDVEYVAKFVPRMREFSDDGVVLNGAYGYRWRQYFKSDQLLQIIKVLKKNPDDRRQVLSMWNGYDDLWNTASKDVPCNLQVLFQITHEGKLDMMVTNRSNDIIWGAYGANAVHFSILQEFMAKSIGVQVGVYRQVSANFHAYEAVFDTMVNLSDKVRYSLRQMNINNPYIEGSVMPYNLMSTVQTDWEIDLGMFLEQDRKMPYADPFFERVAQPMLEAWCAFKDKRDSDRYNTALAILESCEAEDWCLACYEWIQRRKIKAERAKDDGVSYE